MSDESLFLLHSEIQKLWQHKDLIYEKNKDSTSALEISSLNVWPSEKIKGNQRSFNTSTRWISHINAMCFTHTVAQYSCPVLFFTQLP